MAILFFLMRRVILSVFLLCWASFLSAQFEISSYSTVHIACSSSEEQIVFTALDLLERDLANVLSCTAVRNRQDGEIIIGTIGKNGQLEIDSSLLVGRHEAFVLKVLDNGKLMIVGSDAHGTAYGIIELTRLLGVSPWEWWADVTPVQKDSFVLQKDFVSYQAPSVPYRGIFINDEDWGLLPWSSRTYEPYYRAASVNPKTNERIFELLLRLRANTYWPAMHECTVPFFLTKGNREVAAKYGIYIGGSHCEPMACSTPGEWPKRGIGEYNYVNNSENVLKFWEERVKEVAHQEILYTLGMRGLHDGKMIGTTTMAEQQKYLQKVIFDQRELLKKYVNKDLKKIPQVFIPYKEVQLVYDAGIDVPDDVTLMWCDDNFGYIRHFPNEVEKARSGGNGIYYHVSYWGVPHDYLWLGTFSPALLYQQMKAAYDNGIQKIWILNVGDIKPIEYQIELFMDMAWNIDEVAEKGVNTHLTNFLIREFGQDAGRILSPLMKEYYLLAYISKPEFLGNTRVYESFNNSLVKDMPWDEDYILERLRSFKILSDKVEKKDEEMSEMRKDAYFQLVKYPIQASYQMNKKLLAAQLARHGKGRWEVSDLAYDSIVSLTRTYNIGIHNQAKWFRMMDHQPRRLDVFEPVRHENSKDPMPAMRRPFVKLNGTEYTKGVAFECEGLGYEGKAVSLPIESSLEFEIPMTEKDSIEVEVRCVPTHPINNSMLRYEICLDGGKPTIFNVEAKAEEPEWKVNVLRNQAIHKVKFAMRKKKTHKIKIKALDSGLVLDQLYFY